LDGSQDSDTWLDSANSGTNSGTSTNFAMGESNGGAMNTRGLPNKEIKHSGHNLPPSMDYPNQNRLK
jgi:hypothetical protein